MDKKNSIAQQNIAELIDLNDKRKSKYLRNYRAYVYTPYATLENIKDSSVIGWWLPQYGIEDDTTATPQLNVIKSCIDTLTSKIAQSKVRPFFNTMNGSFKDIQVVKQAQQFFDLYYDAQNVNNTVSNAFRDCCIFDTGVIYIDEVSKKIEKCLPIQVYVRPAEVGYGKISRVFYRKKQCPVTLLPERFQKYVKGLEYVDFGVYYDTFNHIKAYSIVDRVIETETYTPDVVPFVFLHYSNPIVGNSSTSIVDMLVSIQKEIDILMDKIKDASQLSPGNQIFLPEGSNIKASAISNRIGQIMTYKPTPTMTTSPVTVATPNFISEQYMATVNELVEKAYAMVGISQLSSQGVKPTGVTAGIALSTLENVESDRYETQLNAVVRAYVDIAKTCLAVFPADEDILPENTQRLAVKWEDIVAEANKMQVQFSAADSLSKDPSVKLQQLQMLAQSGIIPQSRIAQFLELPDIQTGFSLSGNAINAVLTVISNCVEHGSMEVPDYIPFQMLKEEIINTQLSLKSAGGAENKNEDDIAKLTQLYEIVEQKEQEWQSTIQAQQQQEMMAQQAQMAQQAGVPNAGPNVLSQEAQMTQVPQPDLDVSTPDGSAMNGGWNAQYSEQPVMQ
jgi:hypothetical protein